MIERLDPNTASENPQNRNEDSEQFTHYRDKQRNKGGHDQNHATTDWQIIQGLVKQFNISISEIQHIHKKFSQENFKCTSLIISCLFSQKIVLTFLFVGLRYFSKLECWWAKWVMHLPIAVKYWSVPANAANPYACPKFIINICNSLLKHNQPNLSQSKLNDSLLVQLVSLLHISKFLH